MYNALIVELREIEPNWGDRPDGFLISKEEKDIDLFIDKHECFKWSNTRDYTKEISKRIPCEISKELLEKLNLEKENILWINNSDYKNHVLKIK